ncbi:phytanoyl-CoA dioxygenase family protein [Arenibacter sp. M-2]|uniref:phytanoyl-CoA dioxygenase family protein n=1 Tax=unclassified Arenibacter TaxID=2615047 RepID=UPI000D763631|nr:MULTISPECIES: phytanoyl-CoA dioxygenase family protein [unclassified Arenibacter]MDL5510365.1 phytanoyl-CoA dioxygenase family protein [Arenibacter sp. M-2]PXX31231.1 phytanoyl-CoA dioxygenase PhyH [Arenibacter sp. ARW7G5Y1]|tara:strand:- start:10845 stop:11600 length:756 start_codon:yes stop_codon:yes gene_type:complete
MKTILSEEQLKNYKEDGFCILKNIIPQALIERLRKDCQKFMLEKDEEMGRKGVEMDEINHKGRRYFIALRYKESQAMQDLIFSETLEEITRKILGDNVYLFLEQFVVKGADKRTRFSWHQDSGYLDFDHCQYLSIWCPLDDVTEENGTVYLLPYKDAGVKDRIDHKLDTETNDKVGYFGDNPGVPAILNAGDVALFSSTCFHKSGPNRTNKARRVLLLQYSPEPILKKDGSPLYWAEPFVEDGERNKELSV